MRCSLSFLAPVLTAFALTAGGSSVPVAPGPAGPEAWRASARHAELTPELIEECGYGAKEALDWINQGEAPVAGLAGYHNSTGRDQVIHLVICRENRGRTVQAVVAWDRFTLAMGKQEDILVPPGGTAYLALVKGGGAAYLSVRTSGYDQQWGYELTELGELLPLPGARPRKQLVLDPARQSLYLTERASGKCASAVPSACAGYGIHRERWRNDTGGPVRIQLLDCVENRANDLIVRIGAERMLLGPCADTECLVPAGAAITFSLGAGPSRVVYNKFISVTGGDGLERRHVIWFNPRKRDETSLWCRPMARQVVPEASPVAATGPELPTPTRLAAEVTDPVAGDPHGLVSEDGSGQPTAYYF